MNDGHEDAASPSRNIQQQQQQQQTISHQWPALLPKYLLATHWTIQDAGWILRNILVLGEHNSENRHILHYKSQCNAVHFQPKVQKIKKNCAELIHLWNGWEVLSPAKERQTSTLHTKQSAMHSNKLINSQLSSTCFFPSADSTACLGDRSGSLKAQDEICVEPRKWSKMRSERNAITCAWALLTEPLLQLLSKKVHLYKTKRASQFMLTTRKCSHRVKQSFGKIKKHTTRSSVIQQWTTLPQRGDQPQALSRNEKKRSPSQTVRKTPEPDACSPPRLSVCLKFFNTRRSCVESLTETLCHFPSETMWKRLINDSASDRPFGRHWYTLRQAGPTRSLQRRGGVYAWGLQTFPDQTKSIMSYQHSSVSYLDESEKIRSIKMSPLNKWKHLQIIPWKLNKLSRFTTLWDLLQKKIHIKAKENWDFQRCHCGFFVLQIVQNFRFQTVKTLIPVGLVAFVFVRRLVLVSCVYQKSINLQ